MKKGIWSIVIILAIVVLWTSVRAERGTSGTNTGGIKVAVAMVHQNVDASFYTLVKGIVDVPDPLLVLTPVDLTEDASRTAQQKQTRAAKIQTLVKSISAVEDLEVGLTEQNKLEIAEAALSAQEKTGVDAVFMIALARMESDFRRISNVNAPCKAGIQQYGCYADCGMTQHHIRGPAKYVNARCKALARNVKESFFLSATEIASHVNWCQARSHQPWFRPLRQCVLNRYNMGPYYSTASGCMRLYDCKAKRIDLQRETYEEFYTSVARCKAQQRKCILRSSYWDRVTCFEYGARKHQRSVRNCRWCTDITYITKFFYKVTREPTAVATVKTPRIPPNEKAANLTKESNNRTFSKGVAQ